MPKYDDLPKKIEGVFERTGLGNQDPERIVDFMEQYEKTMSTAERVKKKSGKDFESILSEAPDTDFSEES